jgi:hypothetical protein
VTEHCPSCGSAVDDDVAVCPVCGETLKESDAATPAVASAAPAAAAPAIVAGVDPAPPLPSPRVTCPECGATNTRSATECSNCGAALDDVPAPQPARSMTAPAVAADRSPVQTYIIAGLAMLVIALVIYIVSTPAERAMPPGHPPTAEGTAPGGAQGEGLPQGHPPVDQTAQMEALNKRVTDLQAQLATQPENDTLHLALANAMYDAGRHSEARQHYEFYVKRHPDSLDARTDYATSVAASGDVDAAINELTSVLSTKPKHQRAAFNMAIMYRVKGGEDSTGSDPRTKVYRDSVTYWLRRVAEIDSTTPTGRGAVDILRSLE